MITSGQGMVYLVGSGPGDPGLLTIRARECLEEADVVIYDYLANKLFLSHAKKDSELIYVGKKAGCHTMGQEDINRLIVDRAKKGFRVVRLKGGDPFIFGRGGEEAQELVKAGIPFEIIPGVSSAIAVPAYAGIPLTHRDYASSVSFITGHEDPKKQTSNIDWKRLAHDPGTLVFLMGVGNLKSIAENLVSHGKPLQTPVAIIQRGTTSSQRTVTGTLENIHEAAEREKVRPPAVIIVGGVVSLRDELNWFEKKPLFGRRIVVTRAREQASRFKVLLNSLGAECIEFPAIEVMPPKSWEELDKSMGSLDIYDWLLFTSVNGVKYFFDRMEVLGRDVRDLKGIKVGAIGPKTAEAIMVKGIKPDLVPNEYRAEAIVEEFRQYNTKGMKILLPRAARAREILPVELTGMGAQVDVVDAYRTVLPVNNKEYVGEMLRDREINMVTFTSSSTVRNFMEMFEAEKEELNQWMTGVSVACIGPVTAETAEELGLEVSLTAQEYTIESLVEGIVKYYSS